MTRRTLNENLVDTLINQGALDLFIEVGLEDSLHTIIEEIKEILSEGVGQRIEDFKNLLEDARYHIGVLRYYSVCGQFAYLSEEEFINNACTYYAEGLFT